MQIFKRFMVTLERYFNRVYQEVYRDLEVRGRAIIVYQLPNCQPAQRIGFSETCLLEELRESDFLRSLPLFSTFKYICKTIDGPIQEIPRAKIWLKR